MEKETIKIAFMGVRLHSARFEYYFEEQNETKNTLIFARPLIKGLRVGEIIETKRDGKMYSQHKSLNGEFIKEMKTLNEWVHCDLAAKQLKKIRSVKKSDQIEQLIKLINETTFGMNRDQRRAFKAYLISEII